jgi:uncharacterized protein (TIGR03435 family)
MQRIASLTALAIMPVLAQQPKFEIADVRVDTATRGVFSQNAGGVIRDGKYINRDATMLNLIEAAYGVSEDAIAGGPTWLDADLFDVIAKVPDGATPETADLMLQALLADRFGLVVHKGTRPMPRYVLTVAKGGSKLKRASGSGNSGCRLQQQPGPDGDGTPNTPRNLKVRCHNLTAQGIVDNLHQMAGDYLDHDLIDATKLEGAWDFDLEWTSSWQLVDKGNDAIKIFDAVEKQLGLKLDLQNVAAPTLVVDHVNRKPAGNPAGVETALALAAAQFEVAAIKPANPDQQFRGLRYTGGSQMRAGGTLRDLIATAMQMPPAVVNDVLIGLPKSADSERWDITAKLPSEGEGAPRIARGRPQPPPLRIVLEMLRGALVDQFELKTHTENREVTVYALMVAGSKPKMTPADDSERAVCNPDANAPKPFKNVGMMVTCKNTTMAEFSQNLQQAAGYIDHPVFDATGLAGGWNFSLGWTPTRNLHTPQVPNPNQPGGAIVEASDDAVDISVFEALQKELGLKLVKEKRSIPVIVVDHVDDRPLE